MRNAVVGVMACGAVAMAMVLVDVAGCTAGEGGPGAGDAGDATAESGLDGGLVDVSAESGPDGGVVEASVESGLDAGDADGLLSCKLGGGCSPTELCMGGIQGCASNCQCLDGTWQAPCPADLPDAGTPCSPANAKCGYVTSTNPCGAENCYCQYGVWGCGPTCTVGGGPDSGDESGGACTTPQDCIYPPLGEPAVFCCIDKTCVYGPSAVDAVPCADADVELILASNYDQSCQTDSDCVAVSQGNFCIAGAANCQSAAINRSAYPQYQADVARTNAAICGAFTGCPAYSGPCCRSGSCQMGTECLVTVDAGTDAGDADLE